MAKVSEEKAKKAAANQPAETVANIVSNLLDKAYNRYASADVMKWLPEKTDSYQEVYFRLEIGSVLARAKLNREEQKLANKQAQLLKQLHEIYDNAIVLFDGTRVIPDRNGEFHVITRDAGVASTVLEAERKPEAQRQYECRQSNSKEYCEARR